MKLDLKLGGNGAPNGSARNYSQSIRLAVLQKKAPAPSGPPRTGLGPVIVQRLVSCWLRSWSILWLPLFEQDIGQEVLAKILAQISETYRSNLTKILVECGLGRLCGFFVLTKTFVKFNQALCGCTRNSTSHLGFAKKQTKSRLFDQNKHNHTFF